MDSAGAAYCLQVDFTPAGAYRFFGGLLKLPSDVGGVNTQTAYIVVDEIDEHYARAKASGAEIIYDIRDEDYGGRGYSCRDPEGYIWHFGSYDPWKADH